MEGLQPVASAAALVAKIVTDTVFAQECLAWKMGLDVYNAFSRNLAAHPELAQYVDPMTKLLATGSRAAGKKNGTGTTAGTSTGGAAAGSTGSTGTGSTTTGSTSTTTGSSAAPGVPVYTPGGEVGTAPATNTGTGSTGSSSTHS